MGVTVLGRGLGRAGLALALICACLAAASASAAADEPLPPQGAAPPGANDFACRPPPSHPYPVVLVHGTGTNMSASWSVAAPALERLGYCVFALDYGNGALPGVNGVADIATSARQLATFVHRVLAATGAAKVSIVGHSQGGMMPRYFIELLGGAAQVDDLVGLSPSNHGTTTPLAPALGLLGCVACEQQFAWSSLMRTLNSRDQAPAPVSYTVIATRYDLFVTPYYSEFLPAAGGRVTNVVLQSRCPGDFTSHLGIPKDAVATQWMLNALGRAGPADAGFRPAC